MYPWLSIELRTCVVLERMLDGSDSPVLVSLELTVVPILGIFGSSNGYVVNNYEKEGEGKKS